MQSPNYAGVLDEIVYFFQSGRQVSYWACPYLHELCWEISTIPKQTIHPTHKSQMLRALIHQQVTDLENSVPEQPSFCPWNWNEWHIHYQRQCYCPAAVAVRYAIQTNWRQLHIQIRTGLDQDTLHSQKPQHYSWPQSLQKFNGPVRAVVSTLVSTNHLPASILMSVIPSLIGW